MAAALLFIATVLAAPPLPPKPAKPNVLLVIADDLRPQIDAVGFEFPEMSTPNMRKLSEQSLSFTRCYVQQALCGPSRNSFLSGRRPDATKSWNFISSFRDAGAVDSTGLPGKDWTSLPQWFYERGWTTLGAGKVFHPNLPPKWDFPHSWSNPRVNKTEAHRVHNATSNTTTLQNVTERAYDWLYPSEKKCPGNTSWCAIPAHDKNNSDFEDAQIANASLAQLRHAAAVRKATGAPFFVAAGFRKPHLQWKFPARFYNRSYAFRSLADVPLPKHRFFPAGAPAVAFHQPINDFLEAFDDAVQCGSASMGPDWAFPRACEARFRAAYWASVSYLDHQVGLLLDELEALGHANDTVVVFFGEYAATRTPLMVRVPWLAPALRGRHTRALVELVDVMPTLIDVAGGVRAPMPGLDGMSLRPLLEGGGGGSSSGGNTSGAGAPAWPKRAALSQFPRCAKVYPGNWSGFNVSRPAWKCNDCNDIPRANFSHMGLSIRTDAWRYTRWLPWDGRRLRPVWDGNHSLVAELYNHTGDDGNSFDGDFEARNLAHEPALGAVRESLDRQLQAAFAY
eukprot:g4454.t1